jgi:peptidyl-prolyl cis-trans isomerase D
VVSHTLGAFQRGRADRRRLRIAGPIHMVAHRNPGPPVQGEANGSHHMLDALRSHATGWVAKVLFGILVVSFAIWGIGDIFRRPHGGSTLAEVAGTPITVQEVSKEFENRLRQMQQQFGTNLDRRAAVSLGLMQQAVDATVARRLVDAHARDLQLTAADDTVAGIIRENPSLQGGGGFERERLELLLQSLGMNEADYVAAVRADVVRNNLIGSLTGPIQVPELLARKLVEYRLEQRRGRALMVDAATIEIEAPSEETLASYLAANAKTYEAPEYRSITLLTLAPEDLLDEIEVSDADLQAAYDARIDLYRTPEQRRLEQLLAPDEATIRRAAELAAGGQTFTQIAESLKDAKVERSEVGPLAAGDLPESLDKAAFALAQGAVSAPVQSPFGWHLLRVEEVVPEKVRALDAVADELRRELSLEQATNQLPDFATRLDDELAAGTALEAAGEKQGIEVLKIERVDRTGHTPAHERLAADRLTADILTKIFAAGPGETSLLEQTPDGRYFIFRIDAIEPAHERPLAEVHDEVEEAWRAEEQAKRAKARAEELRPQAGSASALAQMAQDHADTRLVEIGPILRSDEGAQQGLNAAAIAALFATRAGEVAPDVVEIPGGAAIVAAEEVIPATVDPQVLSTTERTLGDSLRAELLGSYEAALHHKYTVSVDQSTLAQLMEQMAQ